MFARFDENPAMTLRVIEETKRYGRTDNVKTVYPLQTKFAGGIISLILLDAMLTFNSYQVLSFWDSSHSTAMAMLGRLVHLTTLFSWASLTKR